MRTPVIALLALVTYASAFASQTTPAAAPAAFPTDLAGTWVSEPYELPLSTDFDKSVWGPNAKSVRDVRLVLNQGGEGTLTVTRKVLDAKGRTVAGSTSIEEAKLTVGSRLESPIPSPRAEYGVTVASAERRYPDDKGDPWKIEGLRLKVAVLEENGQRDLEIRFDTPEGRGSFWERLHRQGRKIPARK